MAIFAQQLLLQYQLTEVFSAVFISVSKCNLNADETNKSSNDGNSADTEGEAESEIGETKSQIVKLHNQPVGVQDGHRKHDPNRYGRVRRRKLVFKEAI